jgi:hypothetical protein
VPRRLRYTGRFPPRKVWDRFPNWTLALDEEGRRGQDETTLRPSDRQDTIDRSVTWTAGEVRLADGRRCFAALLVDGGKLDTVMFLDSRRWIEVRRTIGVGWEPGPKSGLRPNDTSIFPMRVRSRLPLASKRRPLSAVVRPDPKRIAAQARHRAELAKELVRHLTTLVPELARPRRGRRREAS